MCLTRLAARCRANLRSPRLQVALKGNYCLKYSCAAIVAALGRVICVFAAWVIAHYHFMYSFVKRPPTGSEHRKKKEKKQIKKTG